MSDQTPEKKSVRSRVSYSTKMVGVTILGVLAFAGPAAAFYDDSPILIPFLQLIQKALKDSLGNTLKSGFQKMAQNQIKAQVERYTKELTANMMPGAFCESDIIKPVVVAGISRATGFEEAKGSFAVTGADSLLTAKNSVTPLYNPMTVIAQHNREVNKSAATAKCKPIQAVPVDLTGTNVTCSQEERRMSAAVLLGANPPALLPGNGETSAVSEVYESARTTMIGRKQLAALALSDTSNEQKQASIAEWRQAFAKPTIEELTKMSADGAASRDGLVLQQISGKLMLEIYVEELEIKRLYAVQVAQRAEADDRNLLGPLRRRVSAN